MSTGPKTQAAFIQGNQSTVDHDAPHSSALFYLFQEVSKLASPIHNSFLDTNLPSTWQKRSETFVDEKELEDEHLQQMSCSSCQNLSCMSPNNQMKNTQEEHYSNNVPTLVEPNSECNSPWKVLSLINLQCERLLHHSDGKESVPESSTTTLRRSADKAATATADVTNQGVGGGCISVKYTLKPPVIYERQGSPADVNPVEDLSEDLYRGASNLKPLCCVKASMVGRCDLSQTANKTDALRPELTKKRETAAPQPHHKSNQREDKMLETALSQGYFLNASLHTQPNLASNEATSVVFPKAAPTLDHNANIALTTEPPCDSLLAPMGSVVPSSQSAPHSYGTTETHQIPSTQNDKIKTTKPECTTAPTEEKSPPVAQLKPPNPSSSGTSEPEPRPVQQEDIVPPSAQKWRTKTPRKQPHPSRSADIQDPHFQGVTFRMDTELDDNREQCRLLITSKYSKELGKSVRKPRLRTRISQKPLKTNSSDEESDLVTRVSSKECASCCTRKTPMWRDAEDGTPLCNACGIRYKKYRVRCVSCWHIPKKEGNSNSCCLKCGNFVRLTSVQRKHTA